jgi:hypothetical protein
MMQQHLAASPEARRLLAALGDYLVRPGNGAHALSRTEADWRALRLAEAILPGPEWEAACHDYWLDALAEQTTRARPRLRVVRR